MSKEEKEAMLNQKMEQIRKRNEDLLKRHEEIKADKQNASQLSLSVNIEEAKPYVMKVPRSRPEKPETEPLDEGDEDLTSPRTNDSIMPNRQRLPQIDGPPPDPSFRFLADPDRDAFMDKAGNDGRGKRSAHKGNRGRGRGNDSGTENDNDNDKDNINGDDWRGNGRRGNYRNKTNDFQGRGRERGKWRETDREEGNFGETAECYDGDVSNSTQDTSLCCSADVNSPPHNYKEAGEPSKQWQQRDGEPSNFYNNGYRGRGRGRGRGRERGGTSRGGRGQGNRRGGRRGGRGSGPVQEYERWKAEREVIDEARLTRARTRGGEWRREWDSEKLDQEEKAETGIIYDPRFPPNKDSVTLNDFIMPSTNKPSISNNELSRSSHGTEGTINIGQQEQEVIKPIIIDE